MAKPSMGIAGSFWSEEMMFFVSCWSYGIYVCIYAETNVVVGRQTDWDRVGWDTL